MGLFQRIKENNAQQKEDKRIMEACGITSTNRTIGDILIYGIVHYPLGAGKHFQYLSTNRYLLVDETLLAYKLTYYRFSRFLFLRGERDDSTMMIVKERVQKALSDLNGIPIDIIKKQWNNRSSLLKLNYISNEEKQFSAFMEEAVYILKRDYLDKTYEDIKSDDPEVVWDFMKESMLRIEVQSYISNYDSTIQNMISKMI